MQRTQKAPLKKVIGTTSTPAKFCGFDVESVQTILECGHHAKPLTRFHNVRLDIPKKRHCDQCLRERQEALLQRADNFGIGTDEWVGEIDIYADVRGAEVAA
jgi:hypothetical protein